MQLLYFKCPVLNCRSTNAVFWYHPLCGSKLMFRDYDINVVCSGCHYCNIIFNWHWSCGQHDGGYKKFSPQGMLTGLAIWGQSGLSQETIKNVLIQMGNY